MKAFDVNQKGRTVIIHLDRGDLLLESIEKCLKEKNISNAVILSCIGTLRKANFHYITTTGDHPADEFRTLDTPMEVSATQGLILNGQPHLHFVISDLSGSYTGHVENGCEVQNLMEICVQELLDVNLARYKNQFGIPFIDKTEK